MLMKNFAPFAKSTGRLRWLVLVILLAGVLATPLPLKAQGGAVLAARAVLPASTLADGQRSGKALSVKVSGLAIPFDSQPVGSIVGIFPGDYADGWYVLPDSVFDTQAHSTDYLLRLYLVQMSWLRANGGDGSASVVDWI